MTGSSAEGEIIDIDVFNGDADGICALHQWRLANPAPATLLTGPKRDIKLLERAKVGAGDTVTVFDISFDSNRGAALRLLDEGVKLRWFDHHFAGDVPRHPALEAHIQSAADVCSSLIVDQAIGGRYRAWAVVAAFGDNMHQAAIRAAVPLGLAPDRLATLRELGELLNYNGYGDTVADLHFAPERLYRLVAPYEDPFAFIAESEAFQVLRDGFRADIAAAESVAPCLDVSHAAAWILPEAAWARRVIGTLANRLANASPERAHALLVRNTSGSLTVSVRAPINQPEGADALCLSYPTGGGRKAAAGINRLPATKVEDFLESFSAAFGRRP